MANVSQKQLELYTDLKSRGSQLQRDKSLLAEVSELLERMQQLQVESPYSENSAPPLADSPASAASASEDSSTSTTISAMARALASHVLNDRAEDMSSAAGDLFTAALLTANDSVEGQLEHITQNEHMTNSSKEYEAFYRRTGRNLRDAATGVQNKCMELAEMSEQSRGGAEGDVAVARQAVDVLGDLVEMINGRREALEALKAWSNVR